MTHFMYPVIIENISDRLFNRTIDDILMIKIFENVKEINLQDIIKDDIEKTLIIMNATTDVSNRMLPYYE